ncbi:MAG: hypothetical protein HY253_12925 [Burkholderiales bacterium]|nr:hypothetical protein [Burkholderiales bacterium]
MKFLSADQRKRLLAMLRAYEAGLQQIKANAQFSNDTPIPFYWVLMTETLGPFDGSTPGSGQGHIININADGDIEDSELPETVYNFNDSVVMANAVLPCLREAQSGKLCSINYTTQVEGKLTEALEQFGTATFEVYIGEGGAWHATGYQLTGKDRAGWHGSTGVYCKAVYLNREWRFDVIGCSEDT